MTIPAPHSSFDIEAARPKQRARRKGSRAQLATRFFADLYAAWEEQGEACLARAAFHDPVAFMRTVASLMPQKIEVSTPVDGMSDERLAELLDYAERMAALKAVGPVIEGSASDQPPRVLAHQPSDENGLCDVSAVEGGGGPDRAMAPRGEDTTSTLRAVSTEPSVTEHNGLDAMNSKGVNASDSEKATVPYPVGRPQPLSDVEAARLNRAKLLQASDPEPAEHRDSIDPASLF